MVQTESGRIRQLRKGCCWTKRSVMFLIFVLVLLMGIQTVFACDCEEINWKQLMCPYEDKTVVMAGILNETTLGSSSSYYMVLEKMIKVGRHDLTYIDRKRFTMLTPRDCSPTFSPTQPEGILYIIYGDSCIDGVLQSSRCNIELYDDDFYEQIDREDLENIFSGRIKRNCRGDS